jgi:putative ABC transport system substrate-binding protein
MVRLPVDVIVARGLTIAAARNATATTPIVMAADPDPIRSGFVTSLARPGGTITGLTTQALDSEPKQLELLQKALPSLTRVAVLTNADSVDIEQAQWTKAAARSLRIDLTEYSIRSPEQLLVAMAAIGDARTQAVLFRGTLWFLDAKQVAALALRHRLPTNSRRPGR